MLVYYVLNSVTTTPHRRQLLEKPTVGAASRLGMLNLLIIFTLVFAAFLRPISLVGVLPALLNLIRMFRHILVPRLDLNDVFRKRLSSLDRSHWISSMDHQVSLYFRRRDPTTRRNGTGESLCHLCNIVLRRGTRLTLDQFIRRLGIQMLEELGANLLVGVAEQYFLIAASWPDESGIEAVRRIAGHADNSAVFGRWTIQTIEETTERQRSLPT